jgi:cobalamin biosynthesis protein CbiD
MKDDPPHVALAKARILADLRYLDGWKADLIKTIMDADTEEEAHEGLQKRDTKNEGDV